MTKNTPSLAPGHAINVDRLIETRLLLQANSGSGKSWALRRLAEQTYGHCQQIIIDPDGEFHTLREEFDYVLAGKKGDCPADIKSAALLARRLLELNVSAIVDIYELGVQRRLFVQRFLDALMNAPRELWHPVLIILDEAHVFAPQDGHAESSNAVIDLMSRGRKRGFCGVLATQRIAKLHKDAASECNNKLIGRSALDIDMKRAAGELGFTTREEIQSLRTLQDGHFYAFGPALSNTVEEITIGPVKTTHLRAGQRAAPATPPRDRVKKVLAQLADLPQEAEEEAKSLSELRARVKQLEGELRRAPTKPAETVEKVVEVERVVEKLLLKDDQIKRLEGAVTSAQHVADQLATEAASVRGALQAAAVATRAAPVTRERGPHPAAPVGLLPTRPTRPTQKPDDGESLSTAELKILEACAWMESIGQPQADTTAVAFLAGYTVSGHFTNMRGRLRSRGLIEYPTDGTISLTPAGAAVAPHVERPTTLQVLHAAVVDKLDTAHAKLLRPLLACYPSTMSADDLATVSGYAMSGHFTNTRGRLRSLGLITYPSKNSVRAADLLFPEGLS